MKGNTSTLNKIKCNSCNWKGFVSNVYNDEDIRYIFNPVNAGNFAKIPLIECPSCHEKSTNNLDFPYRFESGLFSGIKHVHESDRDFFSNIKKIAIKNEEKIKKFNDGNKFLNEKLTDNIYRFYSGSFKAYKLNSFSLSVFNLLCDIFNYKEISDIYFDSLNDATSRTFNVLDNNDWYNQLNPVVSLALQSKLIIDTLNNILKEKECNGNINTFLLHSLFKAVI